MMIKKAQRSDIQDLVRLGVKLWPDHEVDEMAGEFEAFLKNEDTALFLALEGESVGFAQCQLRRDYVEGTGTSPVGYLEGIFVEEAYRNRGCARDLLKACEAWVKEKGCTEFASDCELGNDTSLAFHLSVGFEEANRIICFTKKL